MERPQRAGPLTSTRVAAAVLSVALHLGFVALVLRAGGPGDGFRETDAPAAAWVALESHRKVRTGRVARANPVPGTPETAPPEAPEPSYLEPPVVPVPELVIPEPDADEPRLARIAEQDTVSRPPDADHVPPAIVMPEAEAAALLRQVEAAATDLPDAPRGRIAWQQDGRHYSAEFVPGTAHDSIEPDRVHVEISTEQQGRLLRTIISLRRLPFSHFAQVIDKWDPMVQLHDDEVVGRMHVNSRFRVLHDAQAVPRLHGKVTTSAGGYTVERRGRREDFDMFPDGVETGSRPIPFSGQGWSFDPSGGDADARVHELVDDTRIRFLGEDGYAWCEGRCGGWRTEPAPGAQVVYFIAAPRAIVTVQGLVSGKFLVHSPRRIVIEGDLTYARDPRVDPQSGDLLGLVSDLDIEIAPPSRTGHGDLHVQAALFAGRRVVVSDAEERRSATLHVLGSLAARSLSESEPRYATRVVYDRRFERLRPPGFPSTNRFAADAWDRQWHEVPERSVSAGHERQP